MKEMQLFKVLPPLSPPEAAQAAVCKRIFDLYCLDRVFHDAYMEDPGAALASAGIAADPSIRMFLPEKGMSAGANTSPVSLPPNQKMLEQRLERNRRLTGTACVPKDPHFRIWRERQIRRCIREIGPKGLIMGHYPVAYELSLGCSVGCPFCGVSAGPLRGLFRYTQENAALWRGILARLHALWGIAAGAGPCYCANEPLDNPDYELFLEDYYREFGLFPQTTTAAAARDTERTRRLLRRGQELFLHYDRLSVLSTRDMKILLEAFSPEELLYTDLLPQFAEAPGYHMVKAGRSAEGESGTIACISGFVINLYSQTVRLVTPVVAGTGNPTGELILGERSFSNAEECENVIRQMTEHHMAGPVSLTDFFRSSRALHKSD